MADSMDLVQERSEEMRQRNLANVLNKQKLPSRSFCVDCEMPIPELRRRTLIGVERCVHCQQITEAQSKHFKGKM
ncbi:TraR/DksA family transcriptional regulator [Rosenbergiella epipactidis]|uniref:TraR/DksA family transcriptional regulator n=1 Tax=Rosenbergiella epipactidis TaxID=1544694 RepID=UPI001F4F051D|nr:TraR/DksA family transcriptional regulator [Rosenbergiella epipactidis]